MAEHTTYTLNTNEIYAELEKRAEQKSREKICFY